MCAAKTFKTFAIAAACFAGLASGGAFAQFAGGPTNHATTVKNLLENGRDDQLVVLEGYIVDQVRRKDYTFKDETGTITVEIDVTDANNVRTVPEVLPARVVLPGRSETRALDEIDDRLRIIEPALVVVISLIVGGILLSVMLPLMGIMSSLGC